MIASLLQRMGFWPHYFSTYCQHGIHAQCRYQCKTCYSYCKCKCHRPNGTVWWLIDKVGKNG